MGASSSSEAAAPSPSKPSPSSATESTSLLPSADTSIYARRRVYFIYLAPALAGFLYGYSIGAISGSVISIRALMMHQNGHMLSALQRSALTSAGLIGAFLASALAFYVGDPLGRRRELLIGSSFYLLGTVLSQIFHGYSYFLIFFSRMMYGIGIGFSMHSAPLYIAEISPPDVRGFLIALKEGFIVLGMVFGFSVVASVEGVLDPSQEWRVTWAVPALFALVILSIMGFYAPPSPRWLVLRGRPDESREALRFLRPALTDDQIKKEVEEMQSMVTSTSSGGGGGGSEESGDVYKKADDVMKPSSASEFPGPFSSDEKRKWAQLLSSKRPLVAGLGLVLLQQVTGQPTVLYYAQSMFEASGMSTATARYSDVIVGACKLLATLLCVPLVDRLGRRPLLFAGISIMMLALLLLTMGFANVDSNGNVPHGWSQLIVGALIVYVTGYQVGFGPITWVLIGELFPLHSRARAIGVAVCANFALNLTTTLLNGPLVESIGQAALFGFFGFMCIVSLIFVHRAVPETKGKSLEQIEAMMRGDE